MAEPSGDSPPAPGGAPTLSPQELNELRRFALGLREATPRIVVTPILVGICVLIYLAQAATSALLTGASGDLLVNLGGNYGPRSLGPEPWRLLTSVFLHGGIAHVAFNMAALYQLGRIAERLYGNLPFLGLYLLTGVAGSLASAAWGDPHLSVGASGAVFGVVGAVLVGMRRSGLQTSMAAFAKAQRQLLILVVANLAFGMLPMIDNAAHVGGLAMGLVCGALMGRRIPPPPGTAGRQALAALGLAGGLLGIYAALTIR